MKSLLLHSHLRSRVLLGFALLLLLLAFVSSLLFDAQPSVKHQQKSLQRYITAQQQNAAVLLKDTALLRKLTTGTASADAFNGLVKKPYGFFVYGETVSGNPRLLFWNNQKILPPDVDFELADGTYFQKLVNGYYVVSKQKLAFSNLANRNVFAYVLIPVLSQYYLQTNHLLTRFVHDEDAVNTVTIADAKTGYGIKSLDGKLLFYIQAQPHVKKAPADLLTALLRLTALICFLIYLHLIATFIVNRRGTLSGLSFLAGTLIVLRLLLFVIPQLFSFRQTGLFDPASYAAGWLNQSLGDLLINALFICWIVLFAWNHIGPLKKIPHFLRGNRIYIAGIAALFFLIIATFQLANLSRSIIADPKISFRVTDFFSLNYFTVIGFLVLALICVCYYYFSRTLFRFIFPAFKDRHVYIYFIIALTGLLFLTFRSGNSIILFHLPVLLWLVVYTLVVSQQQALINRFKITAAGMLFWIFVFSVSLALLILEGNHKAERLTQQRLAQKYGNASDASGERMVNIAMTYIDNRFLLRNLERFKNEEESRLLRDSVIAASFPGYTSYYDTRLYLFDSLNRPVHNEDSVGYPELNTIFVLQSSATDLKDTRYYETAYDKFNYITRREIKDSGHLAGTLFAISSPRQYANADALYPELLRQFSRMDAEVSDAYMYAIYNNLRLTTSSGKYPFKTTLRKEEIPPFGDVVRRAGYDELWYKAGKSRLVVVVHKTDSVIEIITLFSYLFCSFLFLAGLLQLLALILRLIGSRKSFYKALNFNIRKQIHGTVIFVSVLSFIIIGVATISFFINRYKRNNIDRLSRTAGIMVKELQKRIANQSYLFDDSRPADTIAEGGLQKLVAEVADIHNVDVNIYDLNGTLKVSSQEEVYKRGILSTQMHPVAWYHLSKLRESQRVQDEELSSLKYLSIYAVVRDARGDVLAFLHIPYFSSQIDLKQEISNFLVTIINLNAFIFLIAGVIALFITNRITLSFSIIGNKMREITLGQHNEEIEWNKQDEIGELVEQYNRMVQQLEQSADALAKSEREGAWREMARQVAHEIKNPLTPMKLSIQYLQRALAADQPNVRQLTKSVAETLIEQIDHLSKIASDFSQFANISYKKIEPINLHTIIGSLVSLYSTNNKVEITWNRQDEDVIIQGDKSHMTRLFTNLLSNAVEACAERPGCKINMDEDRETDYIIFSIKDNGQGIPEEMRNKIFTPNFTTKTSGTGLGLAMCKSIAESAGGRIWFESETDIGTTFFVLLPLKEELAKRENVG